MIRRVSSSIIYRAISPLLKIENRSRGYIAGSQSPRVTGERLVRQIVSQVANPEPSHVEAIPDGFPFEIVYHSKRLCLKGKYQDEMIEVFVPLHLTTDDPPSIQMIGYISKSKLQHMEFSMTAKPGSIVYNSLFMRDCHNEHMEQFTQLFAIRGFNPCTMNFLFDYFQTRATSISQCQRNHLVEGNGDGFPFEIKDDGPDKLILRRKYQDEIIEVRVRVDKTRHSDDDIERLRMVVDISCGDEDSMTFRLTAFPDNSQRIAIEYIREGCSRFQEAFDNFFENRGIKLSTTNFLFCYIRKLNDKLNAKKCFQGITAESVRQLDDYYNIPKERFLIDEF